MPVAFKYSGLVVGIFATILTAIVCTHCSYILVSILCCYKYCKFREEKKENVILLKCNVLRSNVRTHCTKEQDEPQ